MPNFFTRIPEGTPPRLPGPINAIVPVADIFMIAMVSRPATGSLRNTWVTPASLWLALATAIGMALLLVVDISRGSGGLQVGLAIAILLALLGSASVAVVGAAQRRG